MIEDLDTQIKRANAQLEMESKMVNLNEMKTITGFVGTFMKRGAQSEHLGGLRG